MFTPHIGIVTLELLRGGGGGDAAMWGNSP